MACGFGRGKRALPMAVWVNSAGFRSSQGPWRWEIAEFQASTPGCATLEYAFILPIHLAEPACEGGKPGAGNFRCGYYDWWGYSGEDELIMVLAVTGMHVPLCQPSLWQTSLVAQKQRAFALQACLPQGLGLLYERNINQNQE